MLTLTFFRVHSEAGQRLLDDYVRPLCARLSVRLIAAREGASRGGALAAWDCAGRMGDRRFRCCGEAMSLNSV